MAIPKVDTKCLLPIFKRENLTKVANGSWFS